MIGYARYALAPMAVAVLITVAGTIKAVRLIVDALDDAITVGNH